MPPGSTPPLTRGQLAWDGVLATICTALVLLVNLSGVEATAANSDPTILSVALTVASVATIAVRRLYPLAVLSITLAAVIGLVLLTATVGLAPIGPFVAFYTAAAVDSQRKSRQAVAILVAALALTIILRPVDLSPEGAVVNSIMFGGAYVLAMSVRGRRELFAAELLATEQRAELERQRADAEQARAASAAADERMRITRELHDVIGHAMSVMVVQAGVAERLLESRPDQARQAVADIARTGRKSMSEMRQLLGVLRDGDPEAEALPRSPAPTLLMLDGLVSRVRSAGLRVDLEVSGARGVVPEGIDLAAYRVVQEALTNCLKHAQARAASVQVSYRPDSIDIRVTDDGIGVGSSASTSGQGLAGMRERVAMYDGQLTAGPADAGGFAVHAVFPRPSAPDENTAS